jgi:hypothetical protein
VGFLGRTLAGRLSRELTRVKHLMGVRYTDYRSGRKSFCKIQ